MDDKFFELARVSNVFYFILFSVEVFPGSNIRRYKPGGRA